MNLLSPQKTQVTFLKLNWIIFLEIFYFWKAIFKFNYLYRRRTEAAIILLYIWLILLRNAYFVHPRGRQYESTTCNLGNAYFVSVLNTTHLIHASGIFENGYFEFGKALGVECSPSKCPAKALISFQERAAPRVLLNTKHQQHFLLMIAYIPNGYQRKNDEKKWGISKNKEHEHQCFVFGEISQAGEEKKNSGESKKGLLGIF